MFSGRAANKFLLVPPIQIRRPAKMCLSFHLLKIKFINCRTYFTVRLAGCVCGRVCVLRVHTTINNVKFEKMR